MEEHIQTKIKFKGLIDISVDGEMVPFVNWLNSFNSVYTFSCCRGHNDERGGPFCAFVCFDKKDLARILKTRYDFEDSVDACPVINMYISYRSDESLETILKLNLPSKIIPHEKQKQYPFNYVFKFGHFNGYLAFLEYINMDKEKIMDKTKGTKRTGSRSGINWTNIYMEEDLRALWGDFLVDALLEIMDFDKLIKWVNEPNEWFDNRTPNEVAFKDGTEHIWELIDSHKMNGYD